MGWSARRPFLLAGLLAAGFAASGCAGPGAYVWFESLPPETGPASHEYLIGIGDIVSIHVFGHEEMTLRQRVRSDGRVSVLLIGDVEAKGKHPSALKAELEGRLKDYFVSPSVVVNIEETPPLTVLLMGEVARPGAYSLDLDPRLAHALALGGGLTDYASRTSIFVVRSDPIPMRIRFRFESVYRNIGGAGEFQLHRGDLVEVE
ncbi:MAG: polysaccharide biosynthesis/export family protein [Polyangiaceae bacterium]|jgi:polysaccharide export outer membrane protein